jgi:hypothetical protein
MPHEAVRRKCLPKAIAAKPKIGPAPSVMIGINTQYQSYAFACTYRRSYNLASFHIRLGAAETLEMDVSILVAASNIVDVVQRLRVRSEMRT